MKPAQVAVVLELVSYFFVTLELFGTERLKQLQGRIEGLFTSIKEFEFDEVISSLLFVPNVIRVYVDPLVLTIVIFTTTFFTLGRYIPSSIIVKCAILLSASLIISLQFDRLLRLLLVATKSVSLSLIDLGLWLLRRQKVQGMMLFVGTVLFVIGKMIQFVNSATD